jgi:hypothetical protein
MIRKSYSLDQIRSEGPPIALRLLLEALNAGEPFVTYEVIRRELEKKLKVENIFPTQIGHAAGSLMDQILDVDSAAPLINVLITRANGIPGSGAAGYLATRYNSPRLIKWAGISNNEKLEIVERERRKVRAYKGWSELEKRLFGSPFTLQRPGKMGTEVDGKSPDGRRGGSAESPEHKKLKEWVAKNPAEIGLGTSFKTGKTELALSSCDIVDVFFSNGARFVVVEVKSCRSDDLDFERGIYQCVKYRAVKAAEEKPVEVQCEAQALDSNRTA